MTRFVHVVNDEDTYTSADHVSALCGALVRKDWTQPGEDRYMLSEVGATCRKCLAVWHGQADRVMSMLPNKYHPGPRCSCVDCLRAHA